MDQCHWLVWSLIYATVLKVIGVNDQEEICILWESQLAFRSGESILTNSLSSSSKAISGERHLGERCEFRPWERIRRGTTQANNTEIGSYKRTHTVQILGKPSEVNKRVRERSIVEDRNEELYVRVEGTSNWGHKKLGAAIRYVSESCQRHHVRIVQLR